MNSRIVFLIGFCLFATIFTSQASAQVPRMVNYQGLVTDNSGKPVPNGSHAITFNLYTSPTGGSAIFTENQTVTTSGGVLTATLGSKTALPSNVNFDSAYYLGIVIDGGAELSPRTMMTASPYALNAASADALSANATGAVRSINGADGNLIIEGAGATKVTTVGSTVTISIPSINGVLSITGADSSIATANSAGPNVGVFVAPGGITHAKLGARAVGTDNISTNESAANSVLASDGNGNAVWQMPMLQLPYSSSGSNFNGSIFTIANNQTYNGQTISLGNAIHGIAGVGANLGTFANAAIWGDAGSSFNGVAGYSDGGSGAYAGVLGQGNNSATGIAGVSGSGNGVFGISTLGRAAYFQITNSGDVANAVEVTNAGTGDAIRGSSSSDGMTGIHGIASGQAASIGIVGESMSGDQGTGVTSGPTGVLGKASNASPNAWSVGVRGLNPSITANGIGVAGYQAGSGWGVYGETPNGRAIYGKATSNTFTNFGVVGETVSPNGAAIKATYTGTGLGVALQVDNGAIRVSGTNKSAFIQTVTATNKITPTDTEIDNPICDGDPTAILMVTNQIAPGNISNKNPIAVIYNTVTGHWQIENINGTALTTGVLFNVLVIKQ